MEASSFDREKFVSHVVASRNENRRDSLRTLMEPESVARGSGEADTARGARRAAAERYNVEMRILRLVSVRSCWFGPARSYSD
jgi:hypothetical protein